MKIKFGDLEYLDLLDIERYLKAYRFEDLGLVFLPKLRDEIKTKIMAINKEHEEKQKGNPESL